MFLVPLRWPCEVAKEKYERRLRDAKRLRPAEWFAIFMCAIVAMLIPVLEPDF
jgi:hypothetical protein